MAIPVQYVSANVFAAAGNVESYYGVGQQGRALQGTHGTGKFSVVSAEYDEGLLRTHVTIVGDTLYDTLYEVELGDTFCDPATDTSNLCEHPHTSRRTGGDIPSAHISSDQVDNLQTIDIPQTGDAHKFTVVAPTEAAGYLLAALAGVTNRTSISWNPEGTIATITIPQDIHTAATPIFAGLTLSGLTGILEAKGATAVGVVAATGSLQVFRRNYANDSYEFSLVDMDELGDTVFTDLAAGAILYRNDASPAKWVNLGIGPDGKALIVSPSTHLPIWGLPTMGLDDLSDVTMSGAQDGDLFMVISGTWTRFPKGNHRQVLAMVGGAPVWVDHNYLAYTTTTAPVTTTTVAVTTTTTV